MRVCNFEGCERKHNAGGWCNTHYQQYKKTGTVAPIQKQVKLNLICEIEGCDKEARSARLCHTHYQRIRAHGNVHTNLNEVRSQESQNRRCTVEDCLERGVSRGYCYSHYYRWKKYGDPLGVPTPKTEEEIFWSIVGEMPEEGCWEWPGRRSKKDYGQFRNKAAHRWAWKFTYGELPDELHVHHICANRPCVNPKHLQVLKPVDNIAEMNERQAYRKYIKYLESEVSRLRSQAGESPFPRSILD